MTHQLTLLGGRIKQHRERRNSQPAFIVAALSRSLVVGASPARSAPLRAGAMSRISLREARGAEAGATARRSSAGNITSADHTYLVQSFTRPATAKIFAVRSASPGPSPCRISPSTQGKTMGTRLDPGGHGHFDFSLAALALTHVHCAQNLAVYTPPYTRRWLHFRGLRVPREFSGWQKWLVYAHAHTPAMIA